MGIKIRNWQKNGGFRKWNLWNNRILRIQIQLFILNNKYHSITILSHIQKDSK